MNKTQYIVLAFVLFFVYNMTAAVCINWLNPIPGWILLGVEVAAIIGGVIYSLIKKK